MEKSFDTALDNGLQNSMPVDECSEQLTDAQQDLQNALDNALAQAQHHQNDFLRARADMENQRKRHQDEMDKTRKFAIEAFANQLLGVMDAMQAALADNTGNVETLKQGVELTHKQLASAFERFKITQMDPIGEVFNPEFHQAISTQASEQAANTVVQVLQKGYCLQGRLLRPALVMTSSGPVATPDDKAL